MVHFKEFSVVLNAHLIDHKGYIRLYMAYIIDIV